MNKIAIIDAELIDNKKHRFPNLACMKFSGYEKSAGQDVTLELSYDNLDAYETIFLSKVFTKTKVPEWVLKDKRVWYGGTGFDYVKNNKLPPEIEFHKPDYSLYDKWLATQPKNRFNRGEYKYYTDYSIGFLTRGCFRHCEFCVNKNCDRVEPHSPTSQFLDKNRRKICLLDDNFLGYHGWKELLLELIKTEKPFQFKQGLDVRLLTREKCRILSESKYDGDFIFAFDDIKDKAEIEEKLALFRSYITKTTKFYVLCGYDKSRKYDLNFWKKDVIDTFARIEVLMQYKCLPYIMRYEKWEESPYRGMYINLARWCNQPQFYKKKTFFEFVEANGDKSSARKYMDLFLKDIPEAEKFIHLRFGDI